MPVPKATPVAPPTPAPVPPVAPPLPVERGFTPEELEAHLNADEVIMTPGDIQSGFDLVLQRLAEIQAQLLTPITMGQIGMTDAGFSFNFSLLSPAPNSVPFQVTFRRATIEEAEAAMPVIHDWIQQRAKTGWHFNVPQPAPEPKVEALAREAGGQKAVDAVKTAQAQAPAPSTSDGQPPNAMRIVKLEVKTGKEWGRATLAFFEDATHRYPDLQVQNWPVEKAMALLVPVMETKGLLVTAANGTVGVMPGAFNLTCTALWQEGAEYTKPDGQKARYKNLIQLRPLAAA